MLSINWGIILNIFIILQLYLDNIFYDTLTFNVFVLFEGAYSVKKMLRNVCSSNKGKALFNWFQLNGKLHFLDRMSFSVEGCLDPNGIMPQGETYAVSPIQLSYSPYSMSAVYAAPLVPVSVKFNSAQQGKRRPV